MYFKKNLLTNTQDRRTDQTIRNSGLHNQQWLAFRTAITVNGFGVPLSFQTSGKSETVDSENNFDEESETRSDSDISNSFISLSSDPASVSDLEYWLNSFTDRFKT